ncbi:ABC transporter A family member 10-like [Chenopodium quinoa]|uniref:ABC transporter A family member 10-like n=1 Tax=Chenopodium quinoa TaxID=63459 RepID=UPI000B76BD4E|nr:ABC transporter A family member 10-like [Chenopodium quinoa]
MANASPSKASYWVQSNALLRKNLTYQKRNKCQNCCLFVFPVLILVLLVVVQYEIEKESLTEKPNPPVPNPPDRLPVLQIPSQYSMAVRSKLLPFQDLPEPSCRNDSSCPATFLYTASNQSFAKGVVGDMFPTATSVNSSDLLEPLVLGTDTFSDEDDLSYEYSKLYYIQHKCNKSSSISLPLKEKNIELECMEGLTLWRNSYSDINDVIYKGDFHVNTKEEEEFAGAFDLQNSETSQFNVVVWYKTPEEVMRMLNMVSNAYLQFLRGKSAGIPIEFMKDMPTHNYENSPKFVTLLSTLLFIWIIVWLFPVILQALVYEKQHKLRMMMKMNGLGDRAYWTISYGYFVIVSLIYMLCFVAVGSLLGLSFFRLNDYSIQFVFYFVYINLQVSVAFLATGLFSNIKTASVVGYLLVFLTGLLGNFLFKSLLVKPFPRIWVIILELYPGFSLFRGLYELQQYAFDGSMVGESGMEWRDLNNPDNGMREVIIIMLVEWVVTVILAYFFDQFSSSGNWWRKLSSPPGQPNFRSNESPDSLDAEKIDVVQEREIVKQSILESAESHPILCDNIRKVYPARDGNPPKIAVKGMYLALPQSGCFGMLGPNGAGKTSFISMMIGLTKPTSGTAFINGFDIRTNMDEIYSMIGVCPQDNLLWETLTGREHLMFYGRLKGLRDAALKEAVEESLKNVNLYYGGFADKQTGKYSGGMQRRLSVAISLIGDPKVVFMDEPSTGLDPASRNNLWNVVKRAKQDRAIVLTTHYGRS